MAAEPQTTVLGTSIFPQDLGVWIVKTIPYPDDDDVARWTRRAANSCVELYDRNRGLLAGFREGEEDYFENSKRGIFRAIYRNGRQPDAFDPAAFSDIVGDRIKEIVFYLNKIDFVRSEERRVGKEGRSR